jgi:hypothetical protein
MHIFVAERVHLNNVFHENEREKRKKRKINKDRRLTLDDEYCIENDQQEKHVRMISSRDVTKTSKSILCEKHVPLLIRSYIFCSIIISIDCL